MTHPLHDEAENWVKKHYPDSDRIFQIGNEHTFYAGADACLAKVLELLRGEEFNKACADYGPDPADWLESKLRGKG